ncbi:hypothetical protein RB601_006857 [Gaeumannomyces tritici]
MDTLYHTIASPAPTCFLAAFGCFYLAAHRRPGDHVRLVLGSLSILGTAAAGYIRGQQPDRDSAPTFILVMLSIAVFLRTFTLLFWKGFVVESTSTLFDTQKLRHMFVFWTTLITDKPTPTNEGAAGHPAEKTTTTTTTTTTKPTNNPNSIPIFVAHTLNRLLTFYALDQLTSHLINTATLGLNLTLDDFAPPKRALLPPSDALNARELCLRAVTAVNWIRATHLALCTLREALAVLHVAVLRAESPDEWAARASSSPLYGAPQEAYTLRRFWGVFWHRLHVETLAAYTPPFSRLAGCGSGVVAMADKMLAAGWIFFSSSLCHAATGWVLTGRSHAFEQARFFLLNWALCLLETVAGRFFFSGAGGRRRGAPVPAWRRMLGYVWVLGIFFALAPGWQYSTVYDSVLDSACLHIFEQDTELSSLNYTLLANMTQRKSSGLTSPQCAHQIIPSKKKSSEAARFRHPRHRSSMAAIFHPQKDPKVTANMYMVVQV